MRQQLIVDPLRGAAQRELAQRGQIAGLEIVANRTLRLVRDVDLAFVQPLDQVVRGEIDDLDVVGLVENAVGHGLAHPNAGDARDDVVDALDMLDVERGEDVDAGGDQLFDVEIALGVAASGRVGVGQFVDQNELRAPLQDRVDIHLGEAMTLVVNLVPGDDFEPGEQGLGLAAAVGFDNTDDDIDPLAPLGLRRLQHLVGLADAGRGAEENLEPAAALLARGVEQRFR